MFNEAKDFPKVALSSHSNPVLTLNHYYVPNESFRLENIVVTVLIQTHL